MTETSSLLADSVLAALQTTINGYLALDPEGAERLADIQGQVLLIELTGFGTRVFVVPGARSLQLFSGYEAEPDCIVRGTPGALLALTLSERAEDQAFSGTVEIVGDNRCAQRLADVFRHLDIDWEEQLARILGDALAQRLGMRARDGGEWLRDSGERLAEHLRDYLKQDSGLLPSDEELHRYLDGVDRLRDDVERLAARVGRLAGGAPDHP